jgi:hypothetical protein
MTVGSAVLSAGYFAWLCSLEMLVMWLDRLAGDAVFYIGYFGWLCWICFLVGKIPGSFCPQARFSF